MRKLRSTVAAAAALAALLSACARSEQSAAPATKSTPAPATHAASTPAASTTATSTTAPATASAAVVSAEPIAKSTGKPVLTMSGRIASTNVGQKLTLDAAQIAAIPTSTLSVYEPFEKRQITFTGVPLADLFAKAGVDPGATTVVMQALDDYQSSFPVAEVAAEGFLATAEAGKPIPIKAGGPIRVVFRASSTLGKLEHSWIWSVNRMTFS